MKTYKFIILGGFGWTYVLLEGKYINIVCQRVLEVRLSFYWCYYKPNTFIQFNIFSDV